MSKLKNIDLRIVSELMKNSKISDRQLAKKIGVSQPTVTRRRVRLEKQGLIEYTAIPNLAKLGYEIMAFSFSSWTTEAFTKLLQTGEFKRQVQLFLSKHPNVIFATTGGSGLDGMNSASISIHKDFADYAILAREIRNTWGKYVAEFKSFIFALNSEDVVRQITFKHFPQHIQSTVAKTKA